MNQNITITNNNKQFENSLRPQKLSDYIGQNIIQRKLDIALKAAKGHNRALDHILLFGPPGLGKTTLAHVIANEMHSYCKIIQAPALEKKGDLAALLTNLTNGELIFIDEIHRLPIIIEEMLYAAMEDYKLDIIIGQGPSTQTLKIDLCPFTLIGATTRIGMLSKPLYDRFGLIHRLDYYTHAELKTIITRAANKLNIEITPNSANTIAKRSRGTPRIANRILKYCRDYAEVLGNGIITESITNACLSLHEIDKLGLEKFDRLYLEVLCVKFNGGPIGLQTLVHALGETDSSTIEDLTEPYLIQLGLLRRTPQGRKATDTAYHYLGLKTK